MKKYMTRKNIRRLAAVVTTLLLVLAFLGPLFNARYPEYTDIIADLVDKPKTDLNNLFIYMMNESLPVGSVYMTTDPGLSTAGDMINHFGGVWVEWGQGCVPVGVDPGDPDFHFGVNIGKLNDTTGVEYNFSSLDLTPDGGMSIEPGKMTYVNDGSVTFAAGNIVATLKGSQNFTTPTNITLGTGHIPQHTHGITTWGFYENADYGTARGRDVVHAGSPDYATPGPSWGAEVLNNRTNMGAVTAFAVPATFTLANNFKLPDAGFTKPEIDYTPTEVIYTAHEVLSESYTATSTESKVTVKDSTVQPYVTCYMYVRTELALLDDWA